MSNVGEFCCHLKYAGVTPAFERKHLLNKENYRPISILRFTSKMMEKFLQNLIHLHKKSFLSPYLCGCKF